MPDCGFTLNNAFMQHSLLVLVGIPELRIVDKRLSDVARFAMTGHFVLYACGCFKCQVPRFAFCAALQPVDAPRGAKAYLIPLGRRQALKKFAGQGDPIGQTDPKVDDRPVPAPKHP